MVGRTLGGYEAKDQCSACVGAPDRAASICRTKLGEIDYRWCRCPAELFILDNKGMGGFSDKPEHSTWTMNRQYLTEDGMQMVVNLCLIDSGYDADDVYDFCSYNSDWALPCKGSSNPMKSHFIISMVNKDYSKAYGMQLIIVDGDKYKDMIAGRLHKQNGRGSWMVYQGCDVEYAEQVTAEHKVNIKTGNGKTALRWVPKYSHAPNHYLDCECYAMAAADTLGLRGLYLQNVSARQEQREQKQYTPEEDWIGQNENWIN